MYLFGINVPILEMLVIFCAVVIVYLVLLEFEFRQLKKISRRFSEDELTLSLEMRAVSYTHLTLPTN